MDNVYPHKANYFLWIGVTTLHKKLIMLYIDILLFRWTHLDSIKKILKTRLLFCFQMHFPLKTCTSKLQKTTNFSLLDWILWCPGDTHIPKKRKFKIKFNVNVFAVMNGNSKCQIELIIRWTRQLLNWDLLCNQLDIIYHTSLSEFKL